MIPKLEVESVPQNYPVPVIVPKPVPYQVNSRKWKNFLIIEKTFVKALMFVFSFFFVRHLLQVEKQVFKKVEKKVPTPIEKIIPVKIEKPVPFHVVKHVPVPVVKPIPIKIPIYKTVVHSHKGH